ncbi:DUF1631 family protein [Methylibium sp.]|uniref:DUF1631 family protein n=1 Tax=Methylibium sp. TaxID=2067992 RepID=UPI003D0A0986
MDVSPLLQRYLDSCLAEVPRWMSRAANDALQALHAPTTRSALRELPVRPRDEAEMALCHNHPLWARRVGELLATRWRAELDAALPEAGATPAPRAVWSADALTLVDDAEAEENIELLRAVQLVDHAAELELHDLQARTATLRGQDTVRKNSNLLRSDLLVRAVWDASEVLGLGAPARKALMRACGEPLAQALRQVAIDAGRRLADWGVGQAAWKASSTPAARRIAPPNSGYDLTRPGALDSLRSRLSTRQASIDGATRAGVMDEAESLQQLDHNLVHVLARRPLGANGAERLMARLPFLEAAGRNDDDREVMLLIAHLIGAVLDDALLPVSVHTALAALQGPLLRVALREPRVLEDHSHPIWQMMIRLASHTAGFQDDDDPRLCTLLKDVGDLFVRLQAAPPAVAVHAQALTALDTLLVDELDAERREAAAPIAKLQAAARRATLVEALRRQVRLELHGATSPWRIEGSTPATASAAVVLDDTLQHFLTGPWADALAHAMLNDGEHAETTRGLLAVVPDLLASLAPVCSENDRRRLVAAVPALVQRLQQGMARIAMPAPQRDAVLCALMARHTELLRAPGSAAPPALTPEEIVRQLRDEELPAGPGPRAAAGDSMFDIATLDTVPAALIPETPSPGARSWLQHLTVGTWCRLVARGDWTVARVLWVDEAREHWLFSDAELGLTHGLTRSALERLAVGGLAAPLEERNLIERAVDALMAPPRHATLR